MVAAGLDYRWAVPRRRQLWNSSLVLVGLPPSLVVMDARSAALGNDASNASTHRARSPRVGNLCRPPPDAMPTNSAGRPKPKPAARPLGALATRPRARRAMRLPVLEPLVTPSPGILSKLSRYTAALLPRSRPPADPDAGRAPSQQPPGQDLRCPSAAAAPGRHKTALDTRGAVEPRAVAAR